MMPLLALMLHKGKLLGTRRRICSLFLFVVRALSFIAATQTCICFQRAPALSGDPWYELADVAVDWSAKPGFQVLPLVPVQRFLENIEQFSWMWMLFLSSEQGSSLPEVIDGCLVVPPL